MPNQKEDLPRVKGVDARIRQALIDNKRAIILTTLLAAWIFLLGGALATAYWTETPVLIVGGGALGVVLHQLITRILKLRRDSVILKSLPVILRVLPREEAALQMMTRLRSARRAG